MQGIYQIHCAATGQVYIGSTRCLRLRESQHRRALRSGKHRNRSLQSAWNLYGEVCFTFHLVEPITEPQRLLEREQAWLDNFQPFDSFRLFNVCETSQGFDPQVYVRRSLRYQTDPDFAAQAKAIGIKANSVLQARLQSDSELHRRYQELGRAQGHRNGQRLQTDPEARKRYQQNLRKARMDGMEKFKQTWANFSPEKKAEIGRKRWETRRKKLA